MYYDENGHSEQPSEPLYDGGDDSSHEQPEPSYLAEEGPTGQPSRSSSERYEEFLAVLRPLCPEHGLALVVNLETPTGTLVSGVAEVLGDAVKTLTSEQFDTLLLGALTKLIVGLTHSVPLPTHEAVCLVVERLHTLLDDAHEQAHMFVNDHNL